MHTERIIFMGTPEFAAYSLQALLEAKLNVVAVVTAPDKPAGRGLSLSSSPVKQLAIKNSLPVLQPTKLKDPYFLKELASYQADLQIIVAFRMLPEQVWSLARLGSFNLHASLLPQYRGAAPIQHAIWQGEKETGVTTFLLDHKIDTGAILYQEKIPILENDNAASLHDKLMIAGAKLLVKTARDLFAGKAKAIPQSNIINKPLKTAPKIYKEDGLINWNKPAREILQQIRALSPYPGAYMHFYTDDSSKIHVLKILDAELERIEEKKYNFVKLFINRPNCIGVQSIDGYSILFKTVQLSGKKVLNSKDFLLGFRVENPDSLRIVNK